MEEQQSEDESDVQDNFQATQNAELYSERASEQQLDNEYLYESRSQLLSHTRQRPSHIDTGNYHYVPISTSMSPCPYRYVHVCLCV